LLPESIESAPHIKNYFVWAGFAEKEMKKLGFDHVKTVHGIVEHEHFFKVEEEKGKNLERTQKLQMILLLVLFLEINYGKAFLIY
jgi:hypothetical protein